MKMAVAVGGFDPWGAAGIIADLRTFSQLGVYGVSVVTSVVPQNTKRIFSVHPLSGHEVDQQFRAVEGSARICKISLIPSPELVQVVSQGVEGMQVVLDPIIRAGTGKKLVSEGVLESLKSKLFSKTFVITPNVSEAEAITGMKIRSESDQKKACKLIHDLGPANVVIKGGHLNGIDVLYDGKEFSIFIPGINFKGRVHGTGCRYASCLCAELAKGRPIKEACMRAKDFTEMCIRNAINHGKGKDANEDMAKERKHVLDRISRAVSMLESSESFWRIIPEVQSNLGECIPCADGRNDVVAVPGRIVRLGNKARATSNPSFGASRHIANLVLSAYAHDFTVKSCINVKYDNDMMPVCRKLGFACVGFSRTGEPATLKHTEGSSLEWGFEQAVRKNKGKVPDIVYDEGEKGKEAMIRIFGKTSLDVAKKAIRIADEYEKRRR